MVDVAQTYNEHAGQWVERLKRGENAAHSLLEKPAMFGLLPHLAGKKILALGCGSAEEVELFLQRGAEQENIVGIDISNELISRARSAYPRASFEVRAMEELDVYGRDTFDFVYSSLALHYSDNWLPILSQVHRILRPGGRMLFSTHHPVKWGAKVQRSTELDTFFMGYERPKSGAPTISGDYLGARPVTDEWFDKKMSVSFYHRPLSAIIRDIVGAGLTIVDFVEPSPIAAAAEVNPGFHAIHSRIPLFMIFLLQK